MLKKLAGLFVTLWTVALAMHSIAVLSGTALGWFGAASVFVLIVTGLIPLAASIIALRSPCTAAKILLWNSAAAPIILVLYGFRPVNATTLFLGGVIAPAIYWRITCKKHSLPPFELDDRASRAFWWGATVLFIILASIGAACALDLPWWPLIGDCSGRPLLSTSGAPANIDLVASIVYVGPGKGRYQGKYHLWALARIDHEYSSSPSLPFHWVLLRGFFLPTDKNARYFVEAGRSYGVLYPFLPVLNPIPCGRTDRLERSTVPIRILQSRTSRAGARLIGDVYSGLIKSRPLPRVNVLLKGPAGSMSLATDENGIYDISGLPAGEYTLWPENAQWSSHTVTLREGEVDEYRFYGRDH